MVERWSHATDHIDGERFRTLTQLYRMNRSVTQCACVNILRQRLHSRGVTTSRSTIIRSMNGEVRSVHFAFEEVMIELIRPLIPSGVSLEAWCQSRGHALPPPIAHSEFVPFSRLEPLVNLWFHLHHRGTQNELAVLIRQFPQNRGDAYVLDSLQRILRGQAKRIRWWFIEALMAVLATHEITSEEEARAKWEAVHVKDDLVLVHTIPMIALVQEWCRSYPEVPRRHLLKKIVRAVARRGYRTHVNALEAIVKGRQRTVRGYVYRAMLAQFPQRASWGIPSSYRLSKKYHADQQIGNAPRVLGPWNEYGDQYRGRAFGVVRLAAVRAEKLYGIPRNEAERLIGGTNKITAKIPLVVPDVDFRSVEATEVPLMDEEFDG